MQPVHSQTNPHISLVGQNKEVPCASLDYLWTQSRIQCGTLKQEKGRIPLNAWFILMGGGNGGGGGEAGVEGLVLALILVTHLVDGNKQKTDREIVTTDFNSPGRLLLSILILGKFIGLTYLRTIMKMTTI